MIRTMLLPIQKPDPTHIAAHDNAHVAETQVAETQVAEAPVAETPVAEIHV